MTSTPSWNRTRTKLLTERISKTFFWSSVDREISRMRFQMIFKIKSGWHQASMTKIQDCSSSEKESMLQFNSILTCLDSIDYNRRKLSRTTSTKRKVINQNTGHKSTLNHLELLSKEDKRCSTPMDRKLTSLRSSFIQPIPPPLSAGLSNLEERLKLSRTRSWPWCQRLSNAPTKGSFKTNTQLPVTTTLICTSNLKSTRRGTRRVKNTGMRGIKMSLLSSHRSIGTRQDLMARRSTRSRVLKNSLRDSPRLERKLSGRKRWLRDPTLVLLKESRMLERRPTRWKMIQTSIFQLLTQRNSLQASEELMDLKSSHQGTMKSMSHLTEIDHLSTCQRASQSKSPSQSPQRESSHPQWPQYLTIPQLRKTPRT